jgi:hypothetical protein
MLQQPSNRIIRSERRVGKIVVRLNGVATMTQNFVRYSPDVEERRLVRGIETFNVLRGGDYFFMPSLSALKWLADAEN